MLNSQISTIFYEIAKYQEILGIEWKPIAFRRAAQLLESGDYDVEEIYNTRGLQGLEELPGIGEAISKKIEEFIKTGRIKEHEKLKRKIPEGLLALLDMPGIGPKKASVLWKKLGIKNLKHLRKAVREGKVAKLKGFGERSQEKIMFEMEDVKRKKRYAFSDAYKNAKLVEDTLKKVEGVEITTIGGSIRRKEQTIGDIDILVLAKNGEKVMSKLVAMPEVKKVLSKGPTKSSVILNTGIQVDVRVVPRESYAAALQYFTGNKQHNIKLRSMAKKKGLKLSEYGLFDKSGRNIASGTDEKKIYDALGVRMPKPEDRKDEMSE